ncbi:MAG: Gfo/Idh/MocA family oxidoreductase [Opitutae bacterium]|nr:Gfo/Idh/MocA family oxidoreductase [Opitutae bacterium]
MLLMGSKLIAAVIGLGVGESHISGFEAHPRCQVKTLCDFNPSVLESNAQKYPEKKLVEKADRIFEDPEIDVVSIASYDSFHAEQIIQCLKSGKHVFVEKPLCLRHQELDLIVDALNSNPNLQLSSNLILRKAPRFEELKKKIGSGELGQPFHFEGNYDYGRLQKLTEGWRGNDPHYSVTHGGAIHLIDLILWLSGKKIVNVHAFGNRIPTIDSVFNGNSLTTANLQFEDGATGQITSNYASVAPHHHKVSVYGTRGTFEQSHLGAAYFHSRDSDYSPERVDSAYPGARKGDLLCNFIDSVLGEVEPIITKEEVLGAMSVSLAIDKSIQTRQVEEVGYPLLK